MSDRFLVRLELRLYLRGDPMSNEFHVMIGPPLLDAGKSNGYLVKLTLCSSPADTAMNDGFLVGLAS